MRSHAFISDHRLNRTFAWARLCLYRIAAFLAEQTGLHALLPRWMQRRLDEDVAMLAQIAAMTIFLSACNRMGPKRKIKRMRPDRAPRGYKLRARSGEWRALVGVKLRRSLSGRTCGARLTAILTVLRDPEPAIADVLHRLRRGFHKRCGFLLTDAAPTARPRAPHLPALVAADTS